MRFSENRLIAWIVLAVCVVGSVLGLGGAGMARERREIVEVFHEGPGDRDSDHCMDAYINRAFENARVMAQEVQLRVDADNASAKTILELLDSYEPENDEGFFEAGSILKQLRQEEGLLYNAVYAAKLSDEERVNFKRAYDDFHGALKYIEKDPYLEMAKDFNDERNANFISELACLVGGADRLWESF